MSNGRSKRLKKARKIRRLNGEALNQLSAGELSIFIVLEHPTPPIRRVKIYDLLRRTPKLGIEGSKKVLKGADVWPHDTLGSLSLTKRRLIAEHLPPRVHDFYRREAA